MWAPPNTDMRQQVPVATSQVGKASCCPDESEAMPQTCAGAVAQRVHRLEVTWATDVAHDTRHRHIAAYWPESELSENLAGDMAPYTHALVQVANRHFRCSRSQPWAASVGVLGRPGDPTDQLPALRACWHQLPSADS